AARVRPLRLRAEPVEGHDAPEQCRRVGVPPHVRGLLVSRLRAQVDALPATYRVPPRRARITIATSTPRLRRMAAQAVHARSILAVGRTEISADVTPAGRSKPVRPPNSSYPFPVRPFERCACHPGRCS